MKTTHLTFCRNCAASCGMEAQVEDNAIVDIKGDKNHPATVGYMCIKGLANMDLHNGENRLGGAERRRADGEYERIDVEHALDEVHARLAGIIAESGPGAVGLYYGTGANNNSVASAAHKAWMHGIQSPYLFSSMTLDQSAKWVTAGRMGSFASGIFSYLDADVFLMSGANPAVSHAAFGAMGAAIYKRLRERQRKGFKLIVVDPRRSETAQIADIHLAIKPGEDAALFAGMIRLVLEERWHDQTFCDRYALGLDALRNAVAPFGLENVAARTGLATDDIVRATKLFSQAVKKSASTGTGSNMGPHSNTVEHLVSALNTICGAYRREGDFVYNVGALSGKPGFKEAVFPPSRTWEQEPKCYTQDIGRCCGEFPTALLPREIIGNGKSRIRALIVVGGNPIKALGQPSVTIPAFEKLDLLVALDQRISDTAARADYRFGTTLSYERDDLTAAIDLYHMRTFAQVTSAIVTPPAGVIDEWQFFWGLARRSGKSLDLKQPKFGLSYDDTPGEVLVLAPDAEPTTQAIVKWIADQSYYTSYAELVSHPRGILFDVTLGKIEGPGVDDGARLSLCPPDVAQEIATVAAEPLGNLQYPYRLLSRRVIEAMNSAYAGARRSRRHPYGNPAFFSEHDMDAIGLSDGDKVRIESRVGSVVAHARRDRSLPQGAIAMTHCWGEIGSGATTDEKGAFSGELVSLSDDLQPINYMPMQTAVGVRVRRAEI